MQKVLHQKAIVQPGGKVELSSSELEVGQTVDVVVLHESTEQGRSILEILNSGPERRLFRTVEEVKAYLAEEEHFLKLLSEWRKETAFQSSPRIITSHPAYQQIIDIGKPALPFIFEDMRENGGWWYPALRAITGANPVPKDARGNRALNDEAWLRWGREHGYA